MNEREKENKTAIKEIAYSRVKSLLYVGNNEDFVDEIKELNVEVVREATESSRCDAIYLDGVLSKCKDVIKELRCYYDALPSAGMLFISDNMTCNMRAKALADFFQACDKENQIATFFTESNLLNLITQVGFLYPSVRRVGATSCFTKAIKK